MLLPRQRVSVDPGRSILKLELCYKLLGIRDHWWNHPRAKEKIMSQTPNCGALNKDKLHVLLIKRKSKHMCVHVHIYFKALTFK